MDFPPLFDKRASVSLISRWISFSVISGFGAFTGFLPRGPVPRGPVPVGLLTTVPPVVGLFVSILRTRLRLRLSAFVPPPEDFDGLMHIISQAAELDEMAFNDDFPSGTLH